LESMHLLHQMQYIMHAQTEKVPISSGHTQPVTSRSKSSLAARRTIPPAMHMPKTHLRYKPFRCCVTCWFGDTQPPLVDLVPAVDMDDCQSCHTLPALQSSHFQAVAA
jgi:hypothetical protein